MYTYARIGDFTTIIKLHVFDIISVVNVSTNSVCVSNVVDVYKFCAEENHSIRDTYLHEQLARQNHERFRLFRWGASTNHRERSLKYFWPFEERVPAFVRPVRYRTTFNDFDRQREVLRKCWNWYRRPERE